MSEIGRSFGDDAAAYDQFRPGYPAALYDDVLGSDPTDLSILEVGAGTGKATADLAARGAQVVALEPDPRMAEVLEARRLPGVRIVIEALEEWAPRVAAFDLVVSAQAWHWVDPTIGLPKVARACARAGPRLCAPPPDTHVEPDRVTGRGASGVA